ncbi:vacuolar membrane zinc transporter [Schizosaccharomyces japonicus yFS275]|uniref:Vacuolar membrane zinc transporter n=1 Tax=Schizosaccharomyces japonicus (strain yFS275 / FY16936) TaxID=402676 RepID=B6JZF2_SCHJY|nr:vacuolar membrane zinc transporter [Schizosaccharomyces japonicus yFS275]EEB06920.1 vacuolar membrane zinc transporter [Schizosaccharomyces japonicus yFS275]
MGNGKGWALSFAANAFCILGAASVWLDVIVNKLTNSDTLDLANSDMALVCGLGMSSGILLYSALGSLYPEALEYFEKIEGITDKKARFLRSVWFILGMVLFNGFNTVVHHYIHKSPFGALHSDGEEDDDTQTSVGSWSRTHSHQSSVAVHHQEYANSTERRPLMVEDGNASMATCACECHHPDQQAPSILSGSSCGSDHEKSMFTVGLQTAIAISLHKLPEGFIIFMTSSSDAGMLVFLAMSVHNLFEGFTIAYPLYLAWHSRFRSFLVGSALTTTSMPLGALLAFLVLHTQHGLSESFFSCMYGCIFAATAGMMIILSLRIVLPQAVHHDRTGKSKNSAFTWLAFGLALTAALNIVAI